MVNNINDLERIFEACLEAVQEGRTSIEEVLDRYPEIASELRPRLEAALWLQVHRTILDPRPGFVSASRSRLVERIKAEQVAQARPLSKQLKLSLVNVWRQLVPVQGSARKRFAFQLAMVVMLLFSMIAGSTGVAYAAQNAIPGDRLYPMKLTIEDGQLFLMPGLAGDIGLHITFSSRRLVEMQSLITENRLAYIGETVNRFENHVFQAVFLLERLAVRNAARASELAIKLSNTLASHTDVLKILAQAVPEQSALEIAHAFQATQIGAASVQEVLSDIGIPVSTATQDGSRSTPTLSIFDETLVFTQTSSPFSTSTLTTSPTPSVIWTLVHTPTATATASVTPTATVGATRSLPTATPGGGENPEPTNTSRPTNTPEPTDAPTEPVQPSNTPDPTKTPRPLPSPTRRPAKTP